MKLDTRLVNALFIAFVVAFVVFALAAPVYAGTDGGEFQNMFNKINGWIGGYLGKVVALAAFVIGISYGAIKQNYVVALGGVLAALLIITVPGVINSTVTALI
jgi:conjugal transfer pilus assembly protein TraA